MQSEFSCCGYGDGIYHISNEVGNCCTLVVGTDRAILFDTMCGIGSLRSYVEEITDLPLTVVNSHGHYDHIGGNYQFEQVYLSQLDWPILDATFPFLGEIETNMGRSLPGCRKSYADRTNLRDIQPGTVFDLGGVTAEVVALPGHTAGSIGLLLREKRMLLVGDALSPQMCLFFPDSLGLDVYRDTLQKVMAMDFDHFLQAHFTQLFPKSILAKFWDCALLPGKKRGYPYVNSHIPEYGGVMYLHSLRDPEINSMICIITKGEQNA